MNGIVCDSSLSALCHFFLARYFPVVFETNPTRSLQVPASLIGVCVCLLIEHGIARPCGTRTLLIQDLADVSGTIRLSARLPFVLGFALFDACFLSFL